MLAPYSMHLILATPAEGSLRRTYTQATRTRQRSPIAIARTASAIIRADSKVITSDKSTFCLIRLVLAARSVTWVIEFKWKVHVLPILLHRQWTVVRRVQVCLRRQRSLLARLPAPTVSFPFARRDSVAVCLCLFPSRRACSPVGTRRALGVGRLRPGAASATVPRARSART